GKPDPAVLTRSCGGRFWRRVPAHCFLELRGLWSGLHQFKPVSRAGQHISAAGELGFTLAAICIAGLLAVAASWISDPPCLVPFGGHSCVSSAVKSVFAQT